MPRRKAVSTRRHEALTTWSRAPHAPSVAAVNVAVASTESPPLHSGGMPHPPGLRGRPCPATATPQHPRVDARDRSSDALRPELPATTRPHGCRGVVHRVRRRYSRRPCSSAGTARAAVSASTTSASTASGGTVPLGPRSRPRRPPRCSGGIILAFCGRITLAVPLATDLRLPWSAHRFALASSGAEGRRFDSCRGRTTPLMP
jgi:hypothetical protein